MSISYRKNDDMVPDAGKLFIPTFDSDIDPERDIDAHFTQEQFPKLGKEPVVTVGILSDLHIAFALHGTFVCCQTQQIFSDLELEVSFRQGQVYFQGELYDTCLFEPLDTTSSFELKQVTIGIHFHWQRVENQYFNGSLQFIVEEAKITAVNHIAVEGYLFSVIASEMSASASLQLLKAHAVISRSWLLAPMLNAPSKILPNVQPLNVDGETLKWYERDAHAHFDVCADDHCQRYQGIARARTFNVERAIEQTRGEVLVYESEICDARFSKSCGGVSELFENCWDNRHFDYLTPVRDLQSAPMVDLTQEPQAQQWIRTSPDSFCNTTDKSILSQVLNNYDQETTHFYRWRVTYSESELSDIVKQRSGIDFGKIIDLIPVKRGASGRIVQLKIIGSKCTRLVGKELEIRKWLSKTHLYSSAFVVDKTPTGFELLGAGWGHGVGLCQIGAAVMAVQGYDYKQILAHYFHHADLQKLY